MVGERTALGPLHEPIERLDQFGVDAVRDRQQKRTVGSAPVWSP
jgi:hypothetical protein